jgi:hypothetical protein
MSFTGEMILSALIAPIPTWLILPQSSELELGLLLKPARRTSTSGHLHWLLLQSGDVLPPIVLGSVPHLQVFAQLSSSW